MQVNSEYDDRISDGRERGREEGKERGQGGRRRRKEGGREGAHSGTWLLNTVSIIVSLVMS